ncbi:hypothetical protein BJX99DRAFT_261092 [Aspergillus californicus]
MAASQNGFLSVMEVYECAKIIISCLNRKDLKNLRLCRKAMEEPITSGPAYLFRRVYVSGYQTDLDVLREISQHPRLAACVQELIWESSPFSDLFKLNDVNERSFISRNSVSECHGFLNGHHRICRDAIDFEVLLETLPSFPRLEHAVVTDLMASWIPLKHDVSGSLSVARSHRFSRPYVSPAMREYQEMEIYCEMVPETASYKERFPSDAKLREIEQWANALVQGVEHTRPGESLRMLWTRNYRSLFLLCTALAVLRKSLVSYRVDKQTPVMRNGSQLTVTSYTFQGCPGHLLHPKSALLPRFATMFSSLKELDLRIGFLDQKFKPGVAMQHLLQQADQLQRLNIKVNQVWSDLDWALPQLPNLVHMGLDGFVIDMRNFEKVPMPWSFAISTLETLSLTDCWFMIPVQEQEIKIKFWPWLLEHDARLASIENYDPADDETVYDEEEYEEPEDTPSIEHELPMARLSADKFRMVLDIFDEGVMRNQSSHENVELLFRGESWGCEPGDLRVFIDDFTTSTYRVPV